MKKRSPSRKSERKKPRNVPGSNASSDCWKKSAAGMKAKTRRMRPAVYGTDLVMTRMEKKKKNNSSSSNSRM